MLPVWLLFSPLRLPSTGPVCVFLLVIYRVVSADGVVVRRDGAYAYELSGAYFECLFRVSASRIRYGVFEAGLWATSNSPHAHALSTNLRSLPFAMSARS